MYELILTVKFSSLVNENVSVAATRMKKLLGCDGLTVKVLGAHRARFTITNHTQIDKDHVKMVVTNYFSMFGQSVSFS